MRVFDISINVCTSIIMPLFLYSLVHQRRERVIYLACSFFAIIEFLYIENLSLLFGLSKGFYEFFNIMLCFLFFSIASKQSALENLFLSCVPTIILMMTDLVIHFILTVQFGYADLITSILKNRSVLVLVTVLSNILLFALFSTLYKRIYFYIRKTMYILLSIVVILCAFIMNRCEEMLYGLSGEMTSISIIPPFVLLCIILTFVFSRVIYYQVHAETEKTRLALERETSYLNSAIKEKERHFEELKHNIQLFLQLLQTNANSEEIAVKAQQLEKLTDKETTISVFQSTAFSAAVYNLKRNANALDIKTTYLCSRPFAITEPDMYLILSTLFEKVANQADHQNTIHITAEELEDNCRMTITYHSGNPKINLPETISFILKKYGALYNVSNYRECINITLIIPLEKDNK